MLKPETKQPIRESKPKKTNTSLDLHIPEMCVCKTYICSFPLPFLHFPVPKCSQPETNIYNTDDCQHKYLVRYYCNKNNEYLCEPKGVKNTGKKCYYNCPACFEFEDMRDEMLKKGKVLRNGVWVVAAVLV